MYELIIIVLMMQSVFLVFLYITDMELKFFSQIGIKQCELLTLKKGKYLFLFFKRKENMITKHAFVCMVAYYIINCAGFIALLVQAITGNNSFVTESCVALVFSNIGLLIAVVSGNPKKLTSNQQKDYFEYRMKIHEDYKNQQKREKR